jgi:hypothetical protein
VPLLLDEAVRLGIAHGGTLARNKNVF